MIEGHVLPLKFLDRMHGFIAHLRGIYLFSILRWGLIFLLNNMAEQNSVYCSLFLLTPGGAFLSPQSLVSFPSRYPPTKSGHDLVSLMRILQPCAYLHFA